MGHRVEQKWVYDMITSTVYRKPTHTDHKFNTEKRIAAESNTMFSSLLNEVVCKIKTSQDTFIHK